MDERNIAENIEGKAANRKLLRGLDSHGGRIPS
jgi:hypothetical protein